LLNAAATALLDFTGANLDFQALVLKNAANPVDPQDIATKDYVDTVAAVPTWGKERLTLSAGDITNGYVDLAQEVVANSLQVVTSGLVQDQGAGLDYTAALNLGVTRVTFETGLTGLLVAGDVLSFHYQY